MPPGLREEFVWSLQAVFQHKLLSRASRPSRFPGRRVISLLCATAMKTLALRLLNLILAASSAFAATMEGTIKDPSGAVIPGVTIELRDETAAQATTLRADSAGQFRAVGLAAGRYQLKIVHRGFQPYTEAAILETNQTSSLEIRLKIAEIELKLQVG